MDSMRTPFDPFKMAILALAFLAAAPATASEASTLEVPTAWYVSPAGSDTLNGGADQPFLTIQHAVDIAAAGDTVRLFDGVYAGAGNAPVRWIDKSLTFIALGGDRDSCVIDCGGADGFRFVDTNLADTHTLAITGLSFVNADTAVAVLRVGNAFSTRVDLKLTDCAVRQGNVGVAAHGGRVWLDRCAISGNAVAGIRGGHVFGITMADCVVRGNGTGLSFLQMSPSAGAVIERCDFVGNGAGINYWQETGSLTLRHCRVDSSTVGHGLRTGTDFEGLLLEDCSVSGNARHGIAVTEGTAVTAARCQINGNAYAGIGLASYRVALHLDFVELIGNAGWGVGKFARTDDPELVNAPSGAKSADKDPQHDIAITNCTVTGNGAGGLFILGVFDPMVITDSTIADNLGGGLVLGGVQGTPVCELTRLTVAGNRGNGVELAAGTWSVAQTLVAFNQGDAVILSGGAGSLSCTDLFGNTGGDWSPALLPQLGVDGNVHADPLFCDRPAGDYALRADSPLTAANSGGCGTIGRLDWACPAPLVVRVSDVPNDQGHALQVTWTRHEADRDTAVDPVLEYCVQRDASGWQDLATLTAARVDTYSVVVPTDAVRVIGRPVPLSRYRVVARTARPDTLYVSLPDSGFSIDNLPPPRPVAGLADGLTYRVIYWDLPAIDDFAEAWVFRGTESGFTPTEPLPHAAPDYYLETHLAWYFYRVQFVDTHGNVSELSDELHGQYPTDVPGASPGAVLALRPNYPNPFNPQTTVAWDLPRAGRASVAVFDLAGRRVRLLADGEWAAGRHEAVWDGRDAAGMRVASGSYVARLEFAGDTRTIVMGLVK